MPLIPAAGAGQRAFKRRQQQDGEVGLHVVADRVVHGEDAGGAEAAACTLVGLRGVGESVAEHDGSACSAGATMWSSDWARSANISAISVSGPILPTALSTRESSRMERMRSPSGVEPGLRRVTTRWPCSSSHAASRFNCVVLPDPSSPSNVIKKPRAISPSLSQRSRDASYRPSSEWMWPPVARPNFRKEANSGLEAGAMITFMFLFFIVVCGIAAYFIAVQAKKQPNGHETRPETYSGGQSSVGRASGQWG